jgi:hypothetical protein
VRDDLFFVLVAAEELREHTNKRKRNRSDGRSRCRKRVLEGKLACFAM